MEIIATIEDLNASGRPIGKMSVERLMALKEEVEQLFIKPQLTDDLFLSIKEDTTGKYDVLVNGGTYNTKDGRRYVNGLKKAESYYIYAQNLMAGDAVSTRYGNVFKNDDYSSRITDKERSDAYNNALSVAHAYMEECVSYCKNASFIKCDAITHKRGSVLIKKI